MERIRCHPSTDKKGKLGKDTGKARIEKLLCLHLLR